MAEALASGLFLAQLLNRGDDSSQVQLGPPKPHPKPKYTSPKEDLNAGTSNLPPPKCPTIYAIVTDLAQVGDPYKGDGTQGIDVQGAHIPFPALVPLRLEKLALHVECHISTAFVTVSGTWSVNCVKKSLRCQCLLAIPMSYQGAVAGVEIEMGEDRVYTTLVVPKDEASSYGAKGSTTATADDYNSYNPELFRLTIPNVDGGSSLRLKVTWFQAMTFKDGLYYVTVPFALEDQLALYQTPISSVTSVTCLVNSGTSETVEVGGFNHPMKELSRTAGRAQFAIDVEAKGSDKWIGEDFVASYKVWSEGIFPNLIVQDPTSSNGYDQGGTFCLSIAPPDPSRVQAFRRAVVFLLDRSGSMTGKPITDARQALLLGLSMLQSEDTFNIAAFDHEVLLFSGTLVNATKDAVGKAEDWVATTCEARGGTNILSPLRQAMEMLRGVEGAVPYIFLITDGAVQDEAHICREMETVIAQGGPATPRISTFGIGRYCNYYFLKMLAVIGRGLSDVAFTSDKIQDQIQRMLIAASTPLLTNIALAIADLPQGCEVYPYPIPDLFCGNPLIVSGRFHGQFPESIKIVGLLPGGTVWELTVLSRKAPQIPLSKVFAKQQLDLLTARAWLSQDKQMEQKAADLSMVTGIPCEYTRVVGFETTKGEFSTLQDMRQKGKKVDVTKYTKVAAIAVVGGLAIGFGSIAATASNLPIDSAADALLDGAVDCCGNCLDGAFDCCGLACGCVGDIGSCCCSCDDDFVSCICECCIDVCCSFLS